MPEPSAGDPPAAAAGAAAAVGAPGRPAPPTPCSAPTGRASPRAAPLYGGPAPRKPRPETRSHAPVPPPVGGRSCRLTPDPLAQSPARQRHRLLKPRPTRAPPHGPTRHAGPVRLRAWSLRAEGRGSCRPPARRAPIPAEPGLSCIQARCGPGARCGAGGCTGCGLGGWRPGQKWRNSHTPRRSRQKAETVQILGGSQRAVQRHLFCSHAAGAHCLRLARGRPTAV